MLNSDEKRGFVKISVWIQEILVLLGCFLYMYLIVHPVLILESQQPVFLIGINFLKKFLIYPGGLTDWLSAFFMQYWISDLSGALCLTICFWLVAFFTRKLMETLTDSRPIHTFHLIPVFLLLVLHRQYDFKLNITLALIINLILVVSYIQWAPKKQAMRTVIGLVISIVLYWITGGAFLLFAVLCGLNDLLFDRKPASGFLLLLISSVLPYAAMLLIFLVPLSEAYLHNLSFENPATPWIARYGLPAFYLIVLIIFFFARIGWIGKLFKKIAGLLGFEKIGYIVKWSGGLVLLLGGIIALSQEHSTDAVQLDLQFNRSARQGRWTDVLETARKYPNINPLVSCQTNFALFQKDILLDKMFSYPQSEGISGLLMDRKWCSLYPEEASSISWKLGLVNESLHWAHEALEIKGATPEILKRLGMVYMVKGEQIAANRFFMNLKNVPFQEKTVEDLIRLNENPAQLISNSEFSSILASMPNEDLVTLGRASLGDLELLLKRNPKNRMAFEYLIAYHLLNGNLKGVLDHLVGFNNFVFFQIPVHIQEAVIFAASVNPKFDQRHLKRWVTPPVFKRFISFQQAILQHRGNKEEARKEVQKQFDDTYWYYLLFVKSTSQQTEDQNEYQ